MSARTRHPNGAADPVRGAVAREERRGDEGSLPLEQPSIASLASESAKERVVAGSDDGGSEIPNEAGTDATTADVLSSAPKSLLKSAGKGMGARKGRR